MSSEELIAWLKRQTLKTGTHYTLDDLAILRELIARSALSRPALPGQEAVAGDWKWMPSYGKMRLNQLVEAVGEATFADRKHQWRKDQIDPERFIGHQIVPTINFNSLNRIVSAFVAAAHPLAPEVPDTGGLVERARAEADNIDGRIASSDVPAMSRDDEAAMLLIRDLLRGVAAELVERLTREADWWSGNTPRDGQPAIIVASDLLREAAAELSGLRERVAEQDAILATQGSIIAKLDELNGEDKARLTTATEDNKRLREALAPFIRHYEPWMEEYPDDVPMSVFSRVTFGALKRARALTLAKGEHNGQ